MKETVDGDMFKKYGEIIEKIRASNERYPKEYEDLYEFLFQYDSQAHGHVLMDIVFIMNEELEKGISKEDILKELDRSFTGRYGREIVARMEMIMADADEEKKNRRQRAFDVMREVMKAAQALDKGETLENILIKLAGRYHPEGQYEEFMQVAKEMAKGEWGKQQTIEEIIADKSKWQTLSQEE